jgi:hypothetical protein
MNFSNMRDYFPGAPNFFDFMFGFFLLIGFFLLLREFFCWYWKVNHRYKLLQKIEENTRCKCQKKEG